MCFTFTVRPSRFSAGRVGVARASSSARVARRARVARARRARVARAPRDAARAHRASSTSRAPLDGARDARARARRRRATARARATRRRAARGSNFDALVFDLDGVLYDGANGYLAHVRARQRAYLRERFGMTAAEAAATRATAFERASQCYKGLRELGLDVESQEAFTAYCRAGAETFLKPNAALASACERCRIGRW